MGNDLRAKGLPEAVARLPDSFYKTIYSQAVSSIDLQTVDPAGQIERVIAALNSRTSQLGLGRSAAALLCSEAFKTDNSEIRSMVLSAASKLRSKLFGNRVATMVPIEISSYCASNCDFCGWKSDNKDMLRLRLSSSALERQVDKLAKLGISHFEIVGGDDLRLVASLTETIATVRRVASRSIKTPRISICVTPLHEQHYRDLIPAGLNTVLTWQETYDESTYRRLITKGPKATGITADFKVARDSSGFLERLRSQESAVRAGLQVGIGVMLGLAPNPAADMLSLITHGWKLIEAYRDTIQPLIIGMPTWNPITTPQSKTRLNKKTSFDAEAHFELIAAVYLLAFPDGYAWPFPNCRVSKTTQVKSVQTAGPFTSTIVRVGPGAYLDFDTETDPQEAFSNSSVQKSSLNSEKILSGEQFVHHFDTHEGYLARFKEASLEIVPEAALLRASEGNL